MAQALAKANLAYLNEVVGLAIDRQIADPHGPIDVKEAALRRAQKRIVGIQVLDSGLVESDKSERRARIEAYKQDAAALEEALRTAGVSHLTIWPTKAWDAVCQSHPLITLNPNDSGCISVSSDWLQSIEQRATKLLGVRPLVALITGGGVGATAVLCVFGVGMYALIGAAAAACVGGYTVGKIVSLAYFEKGEPRTSRLAHIEQKLIREQLGADHASIMKTLLPKNAEVTNGVRVAIDLPPAPADAQENLVRARNAGFDLTLHTVPDAISFRGDPADIFIESRQGRYNELEQAAANRREQERLERERRRMERAWLDPIITTSRGSATAIIVQYGEFPVEKALIDRVLNSQALI